MSESESLNDDFKRRWFGFGRSFSAHLVKEVARRGMEDKEKLLNESSRSMEHKRAEEQVLLGEQRSKVG